MLFLAGLVFASVFVVLTLVLYASSAGNSHQTKKTLEYLDAALISESSRLRDEIVDIRKKELLSAIPILNRWLTKFVLVPRIRRIIRQADLQWTAGRLISMCAGCFVLPAYLVNLRTGSLFISLLAGALCGTLPLAYVLQLRRRRFAKFEENLPEALDLMVSGLRAGHSLNAALRLVAFEMTAPIGPEFRICFDEQNYGLELRTALENLMMRVPLQDLRIASTAILIQKESGGNLAEVLEKASYVIRERFRLKRQVRVHTAQGRLTGMILSLLPIVLGFAMYLISPETISVLWSRPVGLKLLYTSAGMTFIGTLIIRKIVNMKV
jgi:tight adherence protein B